MNLEKNYRPLSFYHFIFIFRDTEGDLDDAESEDESADFMAKTVVSKEEEDDFQRELDRMMGEGFRNAVSHFPHFSKIFQNLKLQKLFFCSIFFKKKLKLKINYFLILQSFLQFFPNFSNSQNVDFLRKKYF